jgi:hypothetical protein
VILALSTPGWSALAALGGALIGGLVTGGATLKLEHSRQSFERGERAKDRQRDDDERAALARGAARMMRTRYADTWAVLTTVAQRGAWPPHDLVQPPPLEDQKLVAAAATAAEWAAVEAAEFTISLAVEARRDDASRADAEGADVVTMTEGWEPIIVGASEKAQAADSALARLSEMSVRKFGESAPFAPIDDG